MINQTIQLNSSLGARNQSNIINDLLKNNYEIHVDVSLKVPFEGDINLLINKKKVTITGKNQYKTPVSKTFNCTKEIHPVRGIRFNTISVQ